MVMILAQLLYVMDGLKFFKTLIKDISTTTWLNSMKIFYLNSRNPWNFNKKKFNFEIQKKNLKRKLISSFKRTKLISKRKSVFFFNQQYTRAKFFQISIFLDYHIVPKISIPACIMSILARIMRTLASIKCKKGVLIFGTIRYVNLTGSPKWLSLACCW